MSTNVFFSHGTRSEQLFHEDLIVESLSIYGNTFYYIPRSLIAKDEILGEDRLSQFKNAFAIEMYLENTDGFDGQGAFIQKFGLMMEQSATLVVARRRWTQLIGRYNTGQLPNRPSEGDLLYFPLTDGLFEIKFVTHQDPFYQAGKLYVYKLQVELFQYASEHIDTGIPDIDDFETLKTYDTSIVQNGIVSAVNVVNAGLGYTSVPTVVFGTDWVASTLVAAGDEIDSGTKRYIVTIAGTTGLSAPNHTSGSIPNGTATLLYTGTRATATALLGVGVGLTDTIQGVQMLTGGNGYTTPPKVTLVGGGYTAQADAVSTIENIDNQYSYGDNNKFREEASYVVFNESNPFGDLV